MAKQSYSIVEYYAEHKGYKCGYCKSPNTNFSHGEREDIQMWSTLYFISYQIPSCHSKILSNMCILYWKFYTLR